MISSLESLEGQEFWQRRSLHYGSERAQAAVLRRRHGASECHWPTLRVLHRAVAGLALGHRRRRTRIRSVSARATDPIVARSPFHRSSKVEKPLIAPPDVAFVDERRQAVGTRIRARTSSVAAIGRPRARPRVGRSHLSFVSGASGSMQRHSLNVARTECGLLQLCYQRKRRSTARRHCQAPSDRASGIFASPRSEEIDRGGVYIINSLGRRAPLARPSFASLAQPLRPCCTGLSCRSGERRKGGVQSPALRAGDKDRVNARSSSDASGDPNAPQ
jgi:hypothetical protein